MKKLCVVLLKKFLSENEHTSEVDWLPSNHIRWIALGHFDDIYTYTVDNDPSCSFLANMKKDKDKVLQHNNKDSYYHPIYLIPNKQSLLNENIDRWFIALVRIHFTQTICLDTQFNEIVSDINRRFENQDIYYEIYRATEFSDVVLDIRCDNFEKLVKSVFDIRKANSCCVGKMYTYFGINFARLTSQVFLCDETDIISLVSIRYSGYNMDITKKQIEIINKYLKKDFPSKTTEYIINGIDDIMLIFNNCRTSDLIDMYKECFNNVEDQICKNSESITRLGIDINISEIETLYKNNKVGLRVCKDIPNLCKTLSRLIASRSDKDMAYFGWLHTILGISNILVRIDKNPVMDEIVYLIAPAIKAFLLNVISVLNTSDFNKSYYDFLYTFSENCSHYLEQLIRIEGQLSHNPEIRPTMYDIPVFMLEYTIAFLNKVSKILRYEDSDDFKSNTSFLLVPCPCERPKAIEVFPASKGIPGLIYIEVPERLLYYPNEIFRALCHELSHYIGESFRNRNSRKKAYIHAVAALIAKNIFNCEDESFIFMLREELEKIIIPCDDLTILDMHNQIINNQITIFGNKDNMAVILKKYFDYTLKNGKIPVYIEHLTDAQVTLALNECFMVYLQDVDILFREIFADVCMLHILKISSSEYVKSLMKEIKAYPDNSSLTYYDNFAIRIFVVLTASKRIVSKNLDVGDDWDEVFSKISSIRDDILNETNGKYNSYIPSNAIDAMLAYAKKCYEHISNSLYNSLTENVQQIYTSLSEGVVEYQSFLTEIDNYRKEYENTSED